MSIIYKIFCEDEDVNEVYVGSTCNFEKRMMNHRSYCRNENSVGYNLKVYQYIREHGGFDCFDFEILEECSCESRYDKERYWIEKLDAKLNICVPARSQKERYEKDRDKNREYNKEYREKNRDKILEQRKEYREKNREKISEREKEKITCECGSVIRKSDKARHERTKKHQIYLTIKNE